MALSIRALRLLRETPVPVALPASRTLHTGLPNGYRLAAVAAVPLLSLTCLLAAAPHAAQAQTLGSPTVFSYTGANQTYTVGAGVTSLSVELWGAGGGGGGGVGTGGGGGFAGGTLTVTAGEMLTIVVGEGGQPNAVMAYGGGGTGTNGGGGRSAIEGVGGSGTFSELIDAGAGGGAFATPGSFGGVGGGLVGGAGVGGGGTQTAGGTGDAGNGSQGQGGGFSAGGGGGGGYFGGGGSIDGSGGGGSSFYSSASLNNTGFTFSGSGGTAGNSGSSDYSTYGAATGVGDGGEGSTVTHGGNGLVILRTITAAASAPEPATLPLLLASALPLAGGLLARRRQRRRECEAVVANVRQIR